MKFLNRQIFTSRPLLETVSTKDSIIIRFAPWNHPISAGRSARYRLTNGSIGSCREETHHDHDDEHSQMTMLY